MNRGDILKTVADRTDLPVAQVDTVLTGLLDAITEGLNTGEVVNIRRFGKWEPRHRKAVVRKNPRTGDAIPVPAKISVGFIPSGNLKAVLNQGKKKPRGRAVRSRGA